jgi:hypothetical protein
MSLETKLIALAQAIGVDIRNLTTLQGDLTSLPTAAKNSLAAAIAEVHAATAAKAPLASPALTGTPTAPTASTGTNTTQLATTAFVRAAIAGTLIKSVAGGVTVNLTATEAGHAMLRLTGALTANIAVTVPAATGWWIVDNRTTGPYTLTVKTPVGSGVAVAQGKKCIVLCDGTNVLPATDDSDSLALTGTPTAPTAAPGTNNTQIANTAFVQAAVAALVDSSPGALDTLAELAAALGNDPNFATTLATQMAARVRFDAAQTLSAAERLQACMNIGVGNPEADFVASYNAAKAA